MSTVICADSFVTLHYRLAIFDAGPESAVRDVMSTFGDRPGTIQLGAEEGLGSGRWVPALEDCLLGLQVGERKSFVLPSWDAVQQVAQAEQQDALSPFSVAEDQNLGYIFGAYRRDLRYAVSREALQSWLGADAALELGIVYEFNPQGRAGALASKIPVGNTPSLIGRLIELDTDRAVVDFNHPLAGRVLLFEVDIIGIL